ncbi:MAG TPA: ABC transporter permease [Candidatus Methylomirabilis sp.]|nr:ABC transporter permease [Candidatus Methylomirabilis sp.]
MAIYVLKRVALMVPVVAGISLILFVAIRTLPGDPAVVMAGDLATGEYIEQLRRSMGLDKPVYVQYLVYLRNIAAGDLGRSSKSLRPVLDEIRDRYPYTIQLTIAGMLVAAVLGIGAGVVSAVRRDSVLDYGSMVVALVGVSVPVFWLGLMLVLVFSVHLRVLPGGGAGTGWHLVLPAVTLGASAAGILARMTRASLLDVLDSDYVRTARAKGLRELGVVLRHALPTAFIPVLTVLGLQFGSLLGGAVITESVFAWPGMGRLIVDSIAARDYALIQGALLVFATSFALVNLVVDVLYAALDPRIRLG